MDAIRIKVCFHSSPKTHKYWYNVSLLECRTIQQFADELLDNHLTHYEHRDLDVKALHMKITIDDYELPVWESSNLLREGDLLNVCLTTEATKSNVSRKRKHCASDSQSSSTSDAKKKKVSFQEITQKLDQDEEENWDDDRVVVSYEACLVGSSMIRSIDPQELVSNRNVLFRSLSGGRIRDLYNYLTSQEQHLVNCRLFVITIGSNDCDSYATMSKIYQDLTELATYLEEKYPEAKVVWNLLVPRLVCRYTKVDEFELKRKSFNEYVKSTLATHLKSKCVHYASHPSFEVDCQESEGQKTLSELLSDGVHISTIFGLSKYVAEINEALKDVPITYQS